MIMRSRPALFSLLALPFIFGCAPVANSSTDSPPPPFADVALEQCGPAPDAGTVYLESQVAQRPRLVRPGRIRYPAVLRTAAIAGRVKFAFVIDPSGKAVESSLRALEVTDPGFDEPARMMVLTSRFVPGLLDGHAVAVCTAQTIHFTP